MVCTGQLVCLLLEVSCKESDYFISIELMQCFVSELFPSQFISVFIDNNGR
jgi:hypothetical protein